MSNNLDNKTIYEIFRACRLCGAGGGYKMPIIPSVVGIDCADIELRQKIRECVQIEVNQDDKMPPLVCELCVDKVNDFYEFLEMCRETNNKTRQRLGLPELRNVQSYSEADNCILGVTEPVYCRNDDEEPMSRRTTRQPVKIKKEDKRSEKKKEKDTVRSLKKELENLIKQESSLSRDQRQEAGGTRSGRSRQAFSDRDDGTLGAAKVQQKHSDISETKPVVKAEHDDVIEITDDDSVNIPRPKRVKINTDAKQDTPNKSIKITIKVPPARPATPPAKTKPRPGPKFSKQDDIPLLGPRSTRRNPSPSPGPKSSKTISSPIGPKSSKKDSSPGPQALKRTFSPPGPKSSKQNSSPSPGPRSSKRNLSPPPGPKSSKRNLSPPPGPKSSKRNLTLPPGPKSSKRNLSPPPGPKSSKRNLSPPPGPKSSKRNLSPPPGPKSSKRNLSPPPGPKSSKRNLSPPPGPKSSKRNLSPPPGPKSSKRNLSPPPGPKSSKRNLSPPPGPKSSKRNLSPPPEPKFSKRNSLARPGPKSSKPDSSRAPEHVCSVCSSVFQTMQGLGSHLRNMHTVKFTPEELACSSCGEWFVNADAANAHHKQHRARRQPYRCRACGEPYTQLHEYNQHVSGCEPWPEAAEVECDKCRRPFPTREALRQHRCGSAALTGGKCNKCSRSYQTQKSLKKHEKMCTSTNKELWSARSALPPASVRVARCDRVLRAGRCHVARLTPDFDLDPRCTYPYRPARVKAEPLARDGMVRIHQDVADQLYREEDYVHWDSEHSSDEDDSDLLTSSGTKRVPSLATLSIKTIYSRRCLGKVPKRLRKVRSEKYDAFFNPETECDNTQDDANDDINSIIDNLGDGNVGGDSMIGSFSLNDIKLTDVKSISDVVIGSANGEIKDSDATINYESDSLIEDRRESVTSQGTVDFDLIKNSDNFNDKQTSFLNNKTCETVIDNESETDASMDDAESQSAKNNNEKDITETSLNINLNAANYTENMQVDNIFGTNEMGLEKSNGDIGNPTDLLEELNELYDKRLMEELDAQIDERDVSMSEKTDKILLEDLVPMKSDCLSLEAISEGEFNFDN